MKGKEIVLGILALGFAMAVAVPVAAFIFVVFRWLFVLVVALVILGIAGAILFPEKRDSLLTQIKDKLDKGF